MPNICHKCHESHTNCECKDDLKTVWEPEPETEAYSLVDYMTICSYAVELSEQVNPMTKTDEDRKRKIQRKALRIAELIIDEIYESMGDKED